MSVSASWRRARGGTAVCVVLDECAFLHSADDSSNKDEDIYAAVKPSLPVVFVVIGVVGWAGMARYIPYIATMARMPNSMTGSDSLA